MDMSDFAGEDDHARGRETPDPRQPPPNPADVLRGVLGGLIRPR